jgi:acetyl esterase/lipase
MTSGFAHGPAAGRALHPPFDPELVPALESAHREAPVTLTPSNLEECRRAELEGTPSLEVLAQGGAEILERLVPGPDGAPDVSLLIIRPPGDRGLLPGLFHTHGGGMVMGNNRTGLEAMIGWVTDPGLVIVSVEYRLAPEHPFPAGVEDCYAALAWTAEHATELGIDALRLVVGGGSAGGGLAAACSLMARDRGGPALAGQMLIYPMLDDRAATAGPTRQPGRCCWATAEGGTAYLRTRRPPGPRICPGCLPRIWNWAVWRRSATKMSAMPGASGLQAETLNFTSGRAGITRSI